MKPEEHLKSSYR